MDLKQQKNWLQEVLKKPVLAKWYHHWVTSQNGKRTPLHDQLPWMTYEAIDWLSDHLKKDMSLFEWGSGGSTLFFSRHVNQVVTVEHDFAWYHQTSTVIEKDGHSNVSLTLFEPERSDNIDLSHTSTSVDFQGFSFERYIKAIDAYPDDFFDVVVVDGRARLGCMKHALQKIKLGGYAVLDNSERIEYGAICILLSKWRRTKMWGPGPYNLDPWETSIWQKGEVDLE